MKKCSFDESRSATIFKENKIRIPSQNRFVTVKHIEK